MHVGIITYQIGHLKTWQITRKMMAKGYRVTLYAFPFLARQSKSSSRYRDRPDQLINFNIEDFCRRHGVGYIAVGGWTPEFSSMLGARRVPDTPDVYLHCTAKIVPQVFIEGRIILNCHPGLLPQNRGVDAFKWSIVNKWPIGVTLHVIDEVIDRGTILHRIRIPVLSTDSLAAVCERAYDFEVDLLGNFEHHIANAKRDWRVSDAYPCSHNAISEEQDTSLDQIFQDHQAELCRLSVDLTAQAHVSDDRSAID